MFSNRDKKEPRQEYRKNSKEKKTALLFGCVRFKFFLFYFKIKFKLSLLNVLCFTFMQS